MASLSKRQAQIARRKKIRDFESKRDRAVENLEKAKEAAKLARQLLANARKVG